MVVRHQAHRVRARYALPVQLAAVQQALQKPRVVHGGRHQTGAACVHRRRFARVQQRHGQQGDVGSQRFGQPVLFFGRRPKARIHHAQGAADGLFQEHAQTLASDRLDHCAQHIGRVAVLPGRAGLKGQGQASQRIDESVGIEAAAA